MKGTKSLPLLKYWNLSFHFCTFLCFWKIGTLFFPLRILKIILHNMNFHALFNFAHETIPYYNTLSFLICCLSAVDRPKWCEVLSRHCWHPVWFYHMCLRWTVWFSFAFVHICIQMTSLIFASVFICPCPYQKQFCETNDIKRRYRIILISTESTELIEALRVIKTKD